MMPMLVLSFFKKHTSRGSSRKALDSFAAVRAYVPGHKIREQEYNDLYHIFILFW